MEMRYVTDADINARLAELKGKVPTVIINDLRDKLMARKDSLTYDQLEKIVQRVLDTYGGQAAKYEQISKRVDDLGKKLSDLSMQLSRLVESLEEKKFEIHEEKASKMEEKIEEVKEKLEKVGEKVEKAGKPKPKPSKEVAPAEIHEVIRELPEKVEELSEKVEKLVKERPEEEMLPVEEEELAPVTEEAPAVEEIVEAPAVEEVEVVREKLPEVAPEEVEAPVEEKLLEGAGEVSVEEVEAHEEITPAEEVVGEKVEEEKVEGGEVEMAEKGITIPQDIATLLFEEEPRKARLEAIPEDIVSTMIALKWLGFLIDRVGMQNLERVLEFYYEIGWISEKVLNQLLRYAKGTRPHHRDPEWKPAEKLTVQDHLISLLFIERLRGLRINRDILDRLEREIKMLEKTLDEFYGV